MERRHDACVEAEARVAREVDRVLLRNDFLACVYYVCEVFPVVVVEHFGFILDCGEHYGSTFLVEGEN